MSVFKNKTEQGLDIQIKQEPLDTEEKTYPVEPYEVPIEIKTEYEPKHKHSSSNSGFAEIEIKFERIDNDVSDEDESGPSCSENKPADIDVRNNLMKTLSMVKDQRKNVPLLTDCQIGKQGKDDTPPLGLSDQGDGIQRNQSTLVDVENDAQMLSASMVKSEPGSSQSSFAGILEAKTREVKKYDGNKDYFVTTTFPDNKAVIKFIPSSGEPVDVFTCRILTDDEISHLRQKERDNIMFKASQYKCETCLEKFSNVSRWDKHINDFHKPDLPFECSICAQRFVSDNELNFHLGLHYRYFNCCFCKFSRQRYDLMENHYYRLHNKTEVMCPDCDKILPTRVEYKKHRFNNHKTQFSCNLCPAIFWRQTAYKEHLDNKHNETPPQFKCLVCSEAFHNSRRLLNHIRGRHAEKVKDPHYCDICNKYYSTLTIYKTHIKKKHAVDEYKFECDYCGKRFYSRPQITQHIDLEHCDDYKYTCDVCNKKCKTEDQLRSHKRNRHTNRKPQKRRNCELCGKSFANRATLEQHTNSHLGLRPYLCPFCDADFSFSGALHTHARLKHKCKLPPVRERKRMIEERERKKKEGIEESVKQEVIMD